MSFAVNTIVTDAQDHFRDMTATKAISYLNRVRPDIIHRLQQRRTTQDVSLTDGTQGYALTGNTRIDEVRYQKSATVSDYDVVHPISKDELVRDQQHWGKLGEGRVRRYFLETTPTGSTINFINTPDTTTSAGYPKVVVYGTFSNTMAAGETIYDDLPSNYVYVAAICLQYARSRKRDQVDFWDKEFEKACQACERYLAGKQAGNEGAQIYPGWRRRSGTT